MMALPRSAGNRRISRAEAVERTARLLAADPDMPIDQAWRFVAGFELGRWKHAVGLEVMGRLASLLFGQEARHES